MHVRGFGAVMLRDGINDRLRFERGRGIIKVDQGLAVHLQIQVWKIFAYFVYIECHSRGVHNPDSNALKVGSKRMFAFLHIDSLSILVRISLTNPRASMVIAAFLEIARVER